VIGETVRVIVEQGGDDWALLGAGLGGAIGGCAIYAGVFIAWEKWRERRALRRLNQSFTAESAHALMPRIAHPSGEERHRAAV